MVFLPARRSRALCLSLCLTGVFLFSALAPAIAPAIQQLPATSFKGEIRTDAKGQKGLWVVAPPTAGTETSAGQYIGPISVVKAGTQVFHWGNGAASMTTATSSSLENELIQLILKTGHDGNTVGGGFYVSTDPTNSINYGAKAVAMTLNRDIYVVTAQSLPGKNTLDCILAIKNAGLSAIQVQMEATWFNLIDPSLFSARFRELNLTMIRPYIAREVNTNTARAIIDLILFDQRYPLSAANWPEDFPPAVRKLVLSQPLSDAEKTQIMNAFIAPNTGSGRLTALYMTSHLQFVQTPLMVALNQLFIEKTGKPLSESL